MLGNIWLSSALIVTAIFSAGAMYKSYSDIQDAKQIQEYYEIISDIKTLIAKQYNKEPEKITRDEIITFLPKGENWGKVLFLDSQDSSDLSNKALINSDGDIQIDQDEKLKLLALKAKLKDIINVNDQTLIKNGEYTFEIGQKEKNSLIKDSNIEKSLIKAIHALSQDILYATNPNKSTVLEEVVEKFTPYSEMYQDFLKDAETSITEEELKNRQKTYFKARIKEKLYQNESSVETRLYKELESIL